MRKSVALILLMTVINCTYVLADDNLPIMSAGVTISTVSRLDLRLGYIEGDIADFTFVIPGAWRGYLVAEREKLSRTSKAMEKIVFYFQPLDRLAKPSFLMSLCVYRKNDFVVEDGHHRLMETRRYVFAVKPAEENQLTDKTNKAIFQIFMDNVNDDTFVINQIRLASHDERVMENTISINGRMLSSPIVMNQDTVYLPLRDVCEAMGYRVGWLPKNRAITITKDDFYCLLTLEDTSANMGHTLLQKNDKTYISSLFFIRQLKSNVEIDERNNVFINVK